MAYEIDFVEAYDRDSLAAELQRIAELTGKRTLASGDIIRYGRVHPATVIAKFGTLGKAHEAAGLVPPAPRSRTDEEILKIILELWTITLRETGRSPLQCDLRKHGFSISARTIAARFGTWRKALKAASLLAAGKKPEPAVLPRRAARAISYRKRYQVLLRDGNQCQICRRTGVAMEIDHVIPVSRGGTSQLENLRTLCFECNRGKGDRLE